MKIALIPPRTNTGESKYSDYLIEGLLKKGINLRILQNPILERPNVRVFLGSLLIKKFLKNEYILHNLDNLGPYFIKNRLKTKLFLTIHDIAPVILPDIHSKIVKFNFETLLPRIIKNTDLIIVPSRSTKQDLITYLGVDEDMTHIVPMGIDKAIFYPKAIDYNLLKKYGINGQYIVYVGNDNPRKNLKTLILAYNNIMNKTDHKLVLIGPINKNKLIDTIKSSKEIQDKKRILKNIVMPGYVDNKDISMIYNASSALVFPSLYEGFGLTPLEAMASNVPVIVSNNSSLSEVVGDAGLYIHNPLNSHEIAGKILEVLQDIELQKKLRKKGLKQASRFNWNETVMNTIKIYEDNI